MRRIRGPHVIVSAELAQTKVRAQIDCAASRSVTDDLRMLGQVYRSCMLRGKFGSFGPYMDRLDHSFAKVYLPARWRSDSGNQRQIDAGNINGKRHEDETNGYPEAPIPMCPAPVGTVEVGVLARMRPFIRVMMMFVLAHRRANAFSGVCVARTAPAWHEALHITSWVVRCCPARLILLPKRQSRTADRNKESVYGLINI